MKRTLLVVCFFGLLGFSANARAVDYCDVVGSVIVCENPLDSGYFTLMVGRSVGAESIWMCGYDEEDLKWERIGVGEYESGTTLELQVIGSLYDEEIFIADETEDCDSVLGQVEEIPDYWFGSTKVIISGEGGADYIVGSYLVERIYGGSGGDNISGMSGNDTIYGDTGNDTVSGMSGNDTVYGGTGNDSLNGGVDADLLRGEDGTDTLVGSEDNDRLYGGDDNDKLYGTTGDDTLYGESGADSLYGNGGTDKLYGGTGQDHCWGGDGSDSLDDDGDGVYDWLYGEAGNDKLWEDDGYCDGGSTWETSPYDGCHECSGGDTECEYYLL